MPSQPPSRHFVLTTTGTDGDLHPFYELGLTLRARGHRVTLATHDHFEERSRKGGLEFLPLVSAAETQALVDQEALWSPLRGPRILARWGMRLVPRQYELLKAAVAEPGAHLVASPGVVAARVVQETTRVPLTSIVLQPWLIPSAFAPPAMMGGLSPPSWSPHWLRQAHLRMVECMGTALIGRGLAQLRSPLGLPPIRRLFCWWFSPTRIVGLFPDGYGAPQPDWPPQVVLAGFPGTVGASAGALPPEVEAFCAAGDPPIAVTFGTGMKHASTLFGDCLEACRRLGRRGIFLTQYRDQLPSFLPPWALACAFAPFAALFPRCAAVVHHGGIGTTARALAAGCPQLILPLAFDQLDNALRVRRLQQGAWLPRRNRAASAITRALSALDAGNQTEPGQPLARRIREADGLIRTADLLE
ncbi:MAG: glycosyltransferase [Verrucomicrobia bacterium]|nr:glycosyltransferase [Verrucomicrobiota bacterium]